MLFIQNMLHNIACHFISVTNTAIDKIEEELMLQLNKALAYHWIMQKIIVAVRKESAEDMALKIVTR